MGCLRRLGCLAVIAVIAVALYFTRARWLPRGWSGKTETAATSTWQPLTPAGAKRARDALASLNQRNGPAFVNVAPGDLASYIVQELSRTLPPSADSIEAAAIGDRLLVRARVRTADLGGKGGLGALGALLGDREQMQLGGTLRIITPGSAELQVVEMRVHDLALPQPLVTRLVQQMSRERPVGIAPNGLPLKTPPYIGDVRVSNGQITLYKAGPAR